MASENRHLRGATNEIEVLIHGNVVVEKGEDIFLAQTATCIVGAAHDHYGYPASYLAGVTGAYSETNFIGIAMKGSVSGTTEAIPVATTGIFRKQIKLGTSATSQAVKVGMTVAGSTIGASGVSLSGTTVSVGTSSDHTYAKIGKCVKSENAATHVDFMLMSRFAGTSITIVS